MDVARVLPLLDGGGDGAGAARARAAAAVAAGLFMAMSPRFLVAFSLNNVGQYPEVNALGALASWR